MSTPRSRPRAALAAAVSLVAAWLVTGCGGERPQVDGAGSLGTPSGAGASRPMATPPVATPATSAGALTQRQLPAATSLGAGWSPHVEPGGGESGVVGNGSWVQRRDTAELIHGLTPIGCPEAAVANRLPTPKWALEGTYRGPHKSPGVALTLEFADADNAALFLARLRAQVRACPVPRPRPRAGGPLALTFTALPSRADAVAALRREYGVDADPNRYLLVAVQRDARVGLVYLAGGRVDDRDRLTVAIRDSLAG